MNELLGPGNLVANCRDLGGLKTLYGNTVRSRRLLRSSALIGMSERTTYLITEVLGPCRYFDLRTDREIERDGAANALVACGWQWRRIPILDEEDQQSLAPVRYQKNMPLYLDAARRILDEISQETVGSRPSFVACSLGKDRTGLVVALILKWLGVSSADIASDFILSNRRLTDQRHLLLPHWRDPSHPFTIVAAKDCIVATETVSADFFPSDSRRDWLEPIPQMELPST